MSDAERGERAEPDGTIRHIDEMAEKYGFSAPDQIMGSDSAHVIPDWGPPVVLFDSRVNEELARLRYPDIYGKPGLFKRLSDRLFGASPPRQEAQRRMAARDEAWASVLDPNQKPPRSTE